MSSRKLVDYYERDLSYPKLIYKLSEKQFKKGVSLPLLIMYFLSLLFIIWTCFGLEKLNFVLNAVLISVVLNFLWISCFLMARRAFEVKWLLSQPDLSNYSFSDALFIYRMQRLQEQIKLLNISDKRLIAIIGELELQRNNQKFKVAMLLTILGGSVALANDSIKVLLKAYLEGANDTMVNLAYIGFLMILIPFVYFWCLPFQALEYGKWPNRASLRSVLEEILLEEK